MFGSLFRLGMLATLIGGSAFALVGPERIKQVFSDGKESVLEAIDATQSMESKLKQIHKQIASLDKETRDLKEEAIRRRVEAERLAVEVDEREHTLAKRAAVLERVSDLLAEGRDQYVIGRTVYSRGEIERDATEKLSLYNVQSETLKSLKETLETKQKAMEIARDNVGRAAALRIELQSKVGLLEAQLQKYRAKENFAATVDEVLDLSELDSDLARARELIQAFEQDLEVKDRMLDERLNGSPEQPRSGIDYEVLDQQEENLVGKIQTALRGAETLSVKDSKSPVTAVVR